LTIGTDSSATMTVSLAAWQKSVLVLGKTLFTVLISVQLAALLWMVVAPQPLYLKAPSRGDGAQVASGIRGTAKYHVFGEAKDEPVQVIAKEVDAPVTRLRLRLLGINKASVAEHSSAIIAPQSGSGDFYKVGDTIQGRTKLAGVYEDKVVIDTNGKLETLKFEDKARSGISARSVAAPKPRSDRRTGGNIRERFSKVKSASDFMDMANQEMANDPEAALKELGLASAGAGEGYRVQPGSILTSLKLVPGDIVLSVNGQRLGDIETDRAVLEQVSTTGNARIEVQRGNNRFVVNHRLN